MTLADRWRLELDRLREGSRFRALMTPKGVDFSSNDYLGYSKRRWACADLSQSGAASRLLRGHHSIWEEVETTLAAWHGSESALVMTSGYAANEGLLGTILAAGDVVFSDQFNHASIIDGIRLGRADRIIFRHNDLDDLEQQMRQRKETRRAGQAWFIVTESLFGMEGDVAPLRELASLAERHDAHLMVDEAHATGCFGDRGSGIVDSLGIRDRVLATVHTGGKALGVPGAYVACSRVLKDYLINRCRHLIFTTALPPIVGGWWLQSLAAVQVDEASRSALRENTDFFRSFLASRGVSPGGEHYIAAVVLTEDARAMEAARRIQEAGFDVRAIRPPTVPVGTARLRISLHADHTFPEMTQLGDAITGCLPIIP